MADQNSGWNELDVDSYKKDANGEEKKVEFEVENSDDAPITSETVKVEVEEPEKEEVVEAVQEEEDTQETPEELDGIKTKGAEKRIRQLVQQRKEREETIAQQNEELKKLKAALINSQQSTQTMEVSSLASHENALKEKIKLAEAAYLKAYDDGEKETLLEAQNTLNDAKTDLKFVSARKTQLEHSQSQAEIAQTPEAQQTQQAQRKFDKRAVEWAKENEWFGKDEVSTAVALAIDQQLKNEGYDPSTSDFYEEVDLRIRKELPNKFSDDNRVADNTKKPPQQVAGGSRKPASTRKVKLSQKDVSLAKKWNIPLDKYASEKAKISKSGDGYTEISNS
jgi:hypothetical protein